MSKSFIPTKKSKYCKTCGRERPLVIFAPKHVDSLYRESTCMIHVDIMDVPKELRMLVLEEISKHPYKSPLQVSKMKNRSRRRHTTRAKKLAFFPVVHEKSLKRRRAAAAQVAVCPPSMTREEYKEYLDSDHWKEFKTAYVANSGTLKFCFVCGDESYDLHHHTYVRLGHEKFEDVVPICRQHHKSLHGAIKSGVSLTNAHTYVKMRYQAGQLGIKVTKIEN